MGGFINQESTLSQISSVIQVTVSSTALGCAVPSCGNAGLAVSSAVFADVLS